MRKLKDNDCGSIIPVILFILTLVGCGALYTLFFLEIAIPVFGGYIPSGDAKTFILMGVYSMPLIILVVGMFALFLQGLKRNYYYGGV